MDMSQSKFVRDRCYIGGEWIDAAGGETIEVINPATGEAIGTVPKMGGDDARKAIDTAQEAFESFRRTTAAERAQYLHKMADFMLANQDELGQLMTTEQGKPLAEAKGEIGTSAAYLRWFAEEARRVYGDVIPSPWPERRILVLKQPVGVVAAITPWNFPSAMLARKLGPAIATGCTAVVKPASQTPLSALAYGVIAEEVGLPKGVINVITGSAGAIGGEFTANPAVRKLTFTGSTEVGKKLYSQCADTMKHISMELGGNAPFIVFDDADLDAAVEGAMASKFRNTGQTCVCANRILVQDGVYDAFADKMAEAMSKLKLGNGLEDGVNQGPLIDQAAVDKVRSLVDDAVSKGGKLMLGGDVHELGGTFFQPTVVRDATTDMAVAKEEIFGPFAPLFRFKTEDEAVKLANDTEYGLACYFYTTDLARAWRVSEELEYGQVGVNAGVITTEVAPFGGVKDSGLGREGSMYGLDDYLNIKYTCIGGV